MRSALVNQAAVGNLGQWAMARSSSTVADAAQRFALSVLTCMPGDAQGRDEPEPNPKTNPKTERATSTPKPGQSLCQHPRSDKRASNAPVRLGVSGSWAVRGQESESGFRCGQDKDLGYGRQAGVRSVRILTLSCLSQGLANAASERGSDANPRWRIPDGEGTTPASRLTLIERRGG